MIFSISQYLHKLFDQEAWSLLFEALQKITYLVYKTEYENSAITPNMINFKLIGERVLENLRKFEKEKNQLNLVDSKIESLNKIELMGDTGGFQEDNKEVISEKEIQISDTPKLVTKSIIVMRKTPEMNFKAKVGSPTIYSLEDIQQECIHIYNYSGFIGYTAQ